MKLLNFTIIKLALFLIVGILIGYYHPIFHQTSFLILGALSILLFIAFIFLKKQITFFSILSYLLILFIGITNITTHTHSNQLYHYSKYITPKPKQNLRIQIYKKLKPNSFYSKYLGYIKGINGKKASGIILINIDSTQQINIDNLLYVKSKLIAINKPLNPHQFDFKKHMEKQQVYDQVFLNANNNIKLPAKNTAYGFSEKIRTRIQNNLKKHSFSAGNLSIINALLLGQRQDISKDTYKSFTQSGAIHILAISGLHIGLLMLLLGWVLSPLSYFKIGKKTIPFIIIFLLWGYAFLTGLSASVVRSVTMFSLITLALYSNRITNTYNTLIISAFILLLVNPLYIFDIGFQLSYCAVFAIITVKPLFDTLWNPTAYLPKKLWDVFSVTVSAQFGILPLSLYYFHQFPALFIISNLVIIPLLGLLLGVGIITLIFAYFGDVPSLLFWFLDNSITALNNFVHIIGSKEDYVFTKLPFNTINLITGYLLIIALVLLWQRVSYKRIVFLAIATISVQVGFIYNKKHAQTEKFVIFNQYKTTLIAHKKGNTLYYAAKNMRYKQSLDNYSIHEFVHTIIKDSLRNCYLFKGKNILIVDANSIYDTTFKSDIILLTQSPKINLNRLIRILKPQQIIADNNNYKSYVTRWKATCKNQNIPFHDIGKDGAIILK